MILVCKLALLGYLIRVTTGAILSASSANGGVPAGFERFDKVRVDGKNFEKVRSIHVNWYNFAIKALMVQLGKELSADLRRDGKRQFLDCLDRIGDKRDLVESARCLVKARHRSQTAKWTTSAQSNKQLKRENSKKSRADTEQNRWVGPFRLRSRHTKHKGRREGRRRHKKTKYLHRSLTKSADAWTAGTWNDQQTHRHKRALLSERGGAQWQVRHEDKAPQLSSRDSKSPVERTYETLTRLKKDSETRRTSPGAKVYDLRMYDLVMGNESPTIAKYQKARTPEEFMHMAIDILQSLTGDKNREKRRETNFRFMSPRLLPVAPDKSETLANNSILSPTILALYDESEDGGGDAKGGGRPKGKRSPPHIASVPKMLKGAGVSKHDREAILALLMDVSGAAGVVDDTMAILKSLNFFDISGEILSAHDRISAIYRTVEDALSSKQRDGMTKRGFDFLEAGQMRRLHDYQGADSSEFAEFIRRHAMTPASRREEALWKRIERIARNIPDASRATVPGLKAIVEEEERRSLDLKRKRHRFKRNGLPFSVLHPTILAPFAFTPSIGPVVLGPVILSPSVFSLLLLNPAVLSPYVLSPAIPIPFILSPYLLSPYVLSPLVMAPFILNPYVLSPNVLNPYLLSPLILSPLVLCPDVVSPMALYASILSPSVASPPIYTDTFLVTSILSPSFLS